MLLAVAKVVFQMIALGFQGVVVFVFDLPARAARNDPCGHVLLGEGPVRDPGMVVKDFSGGVAHRDFTPVDLQGG